MANFIQQNEQSNLILFGDVHNTYFVTPIIILNLQGKRLMDLKNKSCFRRHLFQQKQVEYQLVLFFCYLKFFFWPSYGEDVEIGKINALRTTWGDFPFLIGYAILFKEGLQFKDVIH